MSLEATRPHFPGGFASTGRDVKCISVNFADNFFKCIFL
jgi:hypothetical protein